MIKNHFTGYVRFWAIAYIILSVSILFINCSKETKNAKPNVMIVITDDQRYGDMSCHGNQYIKTPNMDQPAAESIRLTDFHVDPMCAPTRAALMTGQHYSIMKITFTIPGSSKNWRLKIG